MVSALGRTGGASGHQGHYNRKRDKGVCHGSRLGCALGPVQRGRDQSRDAGTTTALRHSSQRRRQIGTGTVRTPTVIERVGLALTFIFISGFAPQVTETPEQMADRLLGAIGGRARWAAVTNTVNDSQQNLVDTPTVLRVVITMDFTRPRFRIDTTGPNLKVVRVIDGPRSWMLTRAGVVQNVPDDLMKTDMQWYAGHVYRTLHRMAARDAALSLSINSQRRLEVHENGARILWFALDARGEPYAFGAHANDAGTASGPWEFVHDGIHHPLWVSSPDGTWRAMIKTLAVNVPLTDEMFARPR